MALMPVSKISDLVERRASGGGARCTERHWTSDNGRLAIDRLAEHVEHPRKKCLAHGGLQGAAGILDRHAARQPLRGRQRDSAHMMRIALRQDLDDDLLVRSRQQQRMDRRQMRLEAYVHDTAADRDDHAVV